MKRPRQKFVKISISLFYIIIGFFVLKPDLNLFAEKNVATSVGVVNSPPGFTRPGDSPPQEAVESSSVNPTLEGDSVSWTATASDPNSNDYYLIICSSDNVAAGDPPSCGGAEYGKSSATPSGTQITLTLADTTGFTGEEYPWFAFVCDYEICSSSYQGSGSTASPFVINYRPSFSSVMIGPACGTDTDIAPGQDICVQAYFSDADITETIDLHVCSTDSFSNGNCDDATLCSTTGIQAGTTGQCIVSGLVPIPTAHGDYDVYIFAEDEHGVRASGVSSHQYTVFDSAPLLIEYDPYSIMAGPIIPAGSSAPFSFEIRLRDDNGVASGINDITSVSGVYFLESAGKDCTADNRNCYHIASCSVGSIVDQAYCYGYSDTCIDYTCFLPDIYYNASAGDWEVHVTFSDEHTIVSDTAISIDDDINIPELLAIELSPSSESIDLGTLYRGAVSPAQEISVGNAGNIIADFTLNGIPMCSDYSASTNPECANSPLEDTISLSQQKWGTTQTFGFDASDAYNVVTTANASCTLGTDCGQADGCLDFNLLVRSDGSVVDSIENNELIWMRLRVPTDQKAEVYEGYYRVSPIANGQCMIE